ncbi:uncharacterized protein LOC142527994 [Primulina tabacum]|uniref:uncharacterized protein LOC142527994 n=1 Tax=Primulina tabacum TaxID=48773 RepID=UPI003F59A945
MSKNETSSTLEDENMSNMEDARTSNEVSTLQIQAQTMALNKEQEQASNIDQSDVETRWNSAYMMLEAAEKFEKAFERFGDEDRKYMNYFDCYELNQDENTDG